MVHIVVWASVSVDMQVFLFLQDFFLHVVSLESHLPFSGRQFILRFCFCPNDSASRLKQNCQFKQIRYFWALCLILAISKFFYNCSQVYFNISFFQLLKEYQNMSVKSDHFLCSFFIYLGHSIKNICVIIVNIDLV